MQTLRLYPYIRLASLLFFLFFLSSCFDKERQSKGSILFVLPYKEVHSISQGKIDHDYLKHLHDQGFDVNYCSMFDVLPDKNGNIKIKAENYHVLVLYSEPGAINETLKPPVPEKLYPDFKNLVLKHLERGGGIFLSPSDHNRFRQQFQELSKELNIGFPAEHIKVEQESIKSKLTHQAYINDVALSSPIEKQPRKLDGTLLTDGSDITQAVSQVLYPTSRLYNAAFTMPLLLNKEWAPLLRGFSTDKAVKIEPKSDKLPDSIAVRKPDSPNPPYTQADQAPVFAAAKIHNKGGGRIIVLNMYSLFHYGQGTKWLYNSEVLSGTLKNSNGDDLKSDLDTFIQNSFVWLAKPTINQTKTKTNLARLKQTYIDEKLVKKNHTINSVQNELNQAHTRNNYRKLYRGFIGLQSEYTKSGYSSIETYETMVNKLKASGMPIDFIIFIEDYKDLTIPVNKLQFQNYIKKINTLNNKYCKDVLNCSLKVFPGYRIRHNLGGWMYIYGEPDKNNMLPVIPANVLQKNTAGNLVLLRQKNCDANGEKCSEKDYSKHFKEITDFDTEFRQFGVYRGQVGYSHFSNKHNGKMPHLRIQDMRNAASAAVMYFKIDSNNTIKNYEDNKTIEQYIISTEGTLPPNPIAYAEIHTGNQLAIFAERQQGFTYASSTTLYNIRQYALGWNSNYTSHHICASEGPEVQNWGTNKSLLTYGGAWYATGRSLALLPINVKSSSGLKEVKISNGRQPFRRFLLQGKKAFSKDMLVSQAQQRMLTLQAKDVNNRLSICSMAYSYKFGGDHVAFCGDHYNDCNRNRMFRGPGIALASLVQEWPAQTYGYSVDGGPIPGVSESIIASTYLSYSIKKPGTANANKILLLEQHFNQAPSVRYADEGVIGFGYDGDQQIIHGLPSYGYYFTYGPKMKNAKMTHETTYTHFSPPTLGHVNNFYERYSTRRGATSGVFHRKYTLGQDLWIDPITRLMSRIPRTPFDKSTPVYWWKRNSQDPTKFDIKSGTLGQTIAHNLILEQGEGFALATQKMDHANFITINRGEPFGIQMTYNSLLHRLWDTNKTTTLFKKGQTIEREVFTLNHSLLDKDKVKPDTIKAELDNQFRYLKSFTDGVKITKGKRRVKRIGNTDTHEMDGLLELDADIYRVDLELTFPATLQAKFSTPVQVSGLGKNWSAGAYLVKGYTMTDRYGGNTNRYRALGIDGKGNVRLPVFGEMGTQMLRIGNPVMAESDKANDLSIQVTRISDEEASWFVSINNPTNALIKFGTMSAMDLPGLEHMYKTDMTLKAGGYVDFWCNKSACQQGKSLGFHSPVP